MTATQRMLLEMKRSAGFATPAELRTLADTWLLIGGTDGGQPLAVPPPAKNADEWLARHADATYAPAAAGRNEP